MDQMAPSATSLTRLDRSLRTLVDHPDDTPSRRAGICARTERLHRFHGTSLIFEAATAPKPKPASAADVGNSSSGIIISDNQDDPRNEGMYDGLSLGPSTVATACTIFHRFYHSESLTEYDVWSVAMASTLLATKIEEEPKTLKQIVDVFAKMYARRLLVLPLGGGDEPQYLMGDGDGHDDGGHQRRQNRMGKTLESPYIAFPSQAATQWSVSQKHNFCTTQTHLNKFGPVYKEWHRQISNTEFAVLRTLGFTVHWIPDAHPHKFILYFCQALELKDNKRFTQRAWNYCNDSYRLDLSVRFPPELIACSAMLLAARDFRVWLPCQPRPWWQVFLGDGSQTLVDVVTVANAILGLCRLWRRDKEDATTGDDDADNDVAIDLLVGSKGYVISLVKRKEQGAMETDGTFGSFNDPGSFLWEHQKDRIETEINVEHL